MQRTIGEEAAISKALKEYEIIPFFWTPILSQM